MHGYKKASPTCLLFHSSTSLPRPVPTSSTLPFTYQSPQSTLLSQSMSMTASHYTADLRTSHRRPLTPFVEPISLDTKAESSAIIVSLTPQQSDVFAADANAILFTRHPRSYHHLPKDSYTGLRACRRLPRHNHRRARTVKDART